jgi:hypothetical protein
MAITSTSAGGAGRHGQHRAPRALTPSLIIDDVPVRGEATWWKRRPILFLALSTVGGIVATAAAAACFAAGWTNLGIYVSGFALLGWIWAAYAWHWRLVAGSARSPREWRPAPPGAWQPDESAYETAEDRRRAQWDRGSLWVAAAVAGLLMLLGLCGTPLLAAEAWRLDRYGVTTPATVERVEHHRSHDSLTVSVPTSGGTRHIRVESGRRDFVVGDEIRIVYDPDPAYTTGVLAGSSPYLGYPLGSLALAVAFGVVFIWLLSLAREAGKA